MVLRGQPFRPAASHASVFGPYMERYAEWAPFLVGWLGRGWRARMAAPLTRCPLATLVIASGGVAAS